MTASISQTRFVPCISPIPADALAACAQVAAIDSDRSSATAAWVDVGIGILGVLGLLTTLWFNRQAWRQAAQADRATAAALALAERNAASAERNAVSAAEQVSIASDTARRQLRAYLSLEPLKLNGLIGPTAVTIDFPVRNSGQTPVANWHFVYGIRVIAGTPTEAMHEAMIAPHRSPHPHQYAFGALQTKEMVIDAPLTPAERLAVADGSRHFVLAGEVIYDDVYGDTHRTTFFYIYQADRPGGLGQLPWHNRID